MLPITLSIPPALAKALDDVRFTGRYPSRSAAAVELLTRGIASMQTVRESEVR